MNLHRVSEETAMDKDFLARDERRVIEVLLEDWKDLLRCTAIDQAVARVGVPFSHASRLRIAEFLVGDTAASGLMRWAPTTYVLTNEEKLIARSVLRFWRQGARTPQPGEDEWLQSGWAADRIQTAFAAMTWLGFMRQTGGRYELADNWESFLKGLGFYFHEVVLTARDERFNTNCAPDFFIMTCNPVRERFNRPSEVASRTAAEGMSDKMVNAVRGVETSGARPLREHGFYGSEHTILNDACGWSDDAIRAVMDHGKLVDLKPETTWYLLGGG
jgi:hypothetical protein